MKRFLIIMILIAFLSCAAVSADNLNETKTFTELQSEIDQAPLESTIYLNSTNYKGSHAIEITKDITINGANKEGSGFSTLDGSKLTRILIINENLNVNLINLKFINGNSNMGGAIVTDPGVKLNIINCSFIENTGDFGAAIFMDSQTNLIIDNCNFETNIASESPGAIRGDNVTIKNSKFTNNKAQGDNKNGGCLYGNNIIIENSQIINSTIESEGRGAGVYANNKLIIKNSTLTGNIIKDGGSGGAAYCNNITIINSEFKNNGIEGRSSQGGAVYALIGIIKNSSFLENYVSGTGDGGAAYGKLIIENSTFTKNTAKRHGGAISGTNITVKTSTFNLNKAGEYGGAINGQHININQSSFIDNEATFYGGGIYSIVNTTINNSVIFNNKAIFGTNVYNKGNLIANNNWWGKNQVTGVEGGTVSNYLILTISENNNIITVEFKVKDENDQITTYNGALSPNLEYKLESNNGKFSKNNSTIENKITSIFIPNTLTESTVTATVNDEVASITFTPIKPTNIVLTSNSPITTNQTLTLTAKLTSNNNHINGNITFYNNLGEVIGTKTTTNGVATLNLNLPAGKYVDYYAMFNGSSEYSTSISNKINITVDKTLEETKLTLKSNSPVIENQTITLLANLTSKNKPVNDTVNFYNDKNEKIASINTKNGIATLNITLKSGNYTGYYATFDGDEKYKQSTSNKINITVNPKKYKTILILEVNVPIIPAGEKTILKACLTNRTQPVTGIINFYNTHGELIGTNTTKNGITTLTLNLKAGTYKNYYATYDGNEIYENTTSNKIKFIVKSNVELSVSDVDMYYMNGSKLLMKITEDSNPLSNIKLKITLNNDEYIRTTNSSGMAAMEIKLPPGNYIAKVEYENITKFANITVKNTITGNNLTKYFQNSSQYEIKVVDSKGNPLKGCLVSFNVNGMFYNRTTKENGSAILPINLPAGNYTITAENTQNGEKGSNTIVVLPTIIGQNIEKYFKNETQYEVKLLDTQGKTIANQKVSFNINGLFYERTSNSNGIAIMQINLPPQVYVVTANYNGCLISSVINVLSTIESENIEMTVNNRIPFKLTILNGHGKPLANGKIKLNINGVIYDRTSDDDGQAKLDINLPKGEYIITTYFNELSQKNTITII